MINAGDFAAGSTVRIPWNTYGADGASITRSTNGTIRIYKDGSLVERTSASGVTDNKDFDSVTGAHLCVIDLSDNDDAGFYAVGSDYMVMCVGAVVDTKTVNPIIGTFSIGKELRPTVAGRTIDVAATGEVDAALVAQGGLTTEAWNGLSVDSWWIAAAENASDTLDDLTNPAGVLELSPSALTNAAGGATVEDIFEADPADFDADADSYAARFLRMLVSTGMIGSAYTQWVGYVSENGTAAVVFKGREHRYAYGTALQFKLNTTLTLTGATFRFNGTNFTCTVVAAAPGSAYTHDVYVDVHASVTETAAFEVGPYPFFLYPTTSDSSDLPASLKGTVNVVDEPS